MSGKGNTSQINIIKLNIICRGVILFILRVIILFAIDFMLEIIITECKTKCNYEIFQFLVWHIDWLWVPEHDIPRF